MAARWVFASHDQERISRFVQHASASPIVAQILSARGVDDVAEVRAFLECKLTGLLDPNLLPGATSAAQVIHRAIESKQKIVVYGDYDADGMTATALLTRTISLLGGDVSCYLPNRLEDGYGLNSQALETLARRGAKLVVSVDCGIASIEEAAKARELGLELVVTDHHELASSLPDASVLVHPRLPGANYPFGHLCGAGVAFKVAWALCQVASGSTKVSDSQRHWLLTAVGMAAIGTVADVVPLTGENRIIVRHGLRYLKAYPPLGISALMNVTKLGDKPALTSEDIAFSLAPRLNAAGRLGQAQLGVELMTTDNPAKADQLASYLHELNNSRDSLERGILIAAQKQIKEQFDLENDAALVLAGRGWHPGVIGIVAGRLAERHARPVVMIALDQLGGKPGIGSARSVGQFNLHRALAACGHRLLSHGGHAAAAGLRIEEPAVDAFRREFLEYAATELSPDDRLAEVQIDAEAPFVQLTVDTINQLEELGPFGHSNPRPVLAALGATVREAKKMGQGERHLSLSLEHQGTSLRGVAFGQADWADELKQTSGPIDVAYRPVINDFRGRKSVEIQLVDWRPASGRN
jgi:single-stranded-DNA-specific exonuclease